MDKWVGFKAYHLKQAFVILAWARDGSIPYSKPTRGGGGGCGGGGWGWGVRGKDPSSHVHVSILYEQMCE